MIKVTGHRGAKDLFPENTLKGFELARDLGCDCIELDIRLTNDNKLIVFHDSELDRTTNGKGSVNSFTLKELKSFDAGNGERIPTLEEVFSLFKDSDISIQIELKGPETEKYVLPLVREWRMENRITFTSFFHHRVLYVKKQIPGITAGILITCNPVNPIAMMQAAQADNLHIHFKRVTTELTNIIHAAKKKLIVWGNVINISDIEKLIVMQVDYIGSNRPDIVLEQLHLKKNISGEGDV